MFAFSEEDFYEKDDDAAYKKTAFKSKLAFVSTSNNILLSKTKKPPHVAKLLQLGSMAE